MDPVQLESGPAAHVAYPSYPSDAMRDRCATKKGRSTKDVGGGISGPEEVDVRTMVPVHY